MNPAWKGKKTNPQQNPTKQREGEREGDLVDLKHKEMLFMGIID